MLCERWQTARAGAAGERKGFFAIFDSWILGHLSALFLPSLGSIHSLRTIFPFLKKFRYCFVRTSFPFLKKPNGTFLHAKLTQVVFQLSVLHAFRQWIVTSIRFGRMTSYQLIGWKLLTISCRFSRSSCRYLSVELMYRCPARY